jgi:hypothetical protein
MTMTLCQTEECPFRETRSSTHEGEGRDPMELALAQSPRCFGHGHSSFFIFKMNKFKKNAICCKQKEAVLYLYDCLKGYL